MPFVDDRTNIADVVNPEQAKELSQTAIEIMQPEPTFKETMKAAFSVENSLGSLIANRTSLNDKPMPVEGYDPLAEGSKEIEGYELFARDFMFSQSPEQTAKIKATIDQEFKNRQTLSESGLVGVAANMAAGMTDPIYLPLMLTGIGAYGKGATAFSTAARTGAISGAAELVAEGAKHATQKTRTIEESLINISGATILSGVLGGAAHGIGNMRYNKMAKNLERDLDIDTVPGIKVNSDLPTDAEAWELVSAGGFENWGVSPILRSANNQALSARQVSAQMMEVPFVTKGNVKGVATAPTGGAVETRIKLHEAPLSEAIEEMGDLYTTYRRGLGKTRRLVNDYVLRNRAGKLGYNEFREEIGKAMRRGDVHEIPEVQQAAQQFRKKVLDPLKNDAIHLKMLPPDVDVKTASSYLSRIYKTKMIIAERPRWNQIVDDWLKKKRVDAQNIDVAKRSEIQVKDADLTDDGIAAVRDSITDNLLGNNVGRGSYQLTSAAKPLKERVFMISDEAIEDFLESDIDLVARQYTMSMGADVELTRMFGDRSMKKQLEGIKAEYDDLIENAKTAKERTKLNNKKNATLKDIEAMRDKIKGTYKMPEDPNAFFVRAGKVLRDVNFVRMLGGMTLSAIPDMARPIAVNGLRPVAKGLLALATSPRTFNIARKQAKKYAVGLDMVLNSRASSMADIADIYARGSAFERGMRGVSDTFSKITLMSQWNAAMKQFSGVVTSDRILKECFNRSTGKITKSNLKRLAQAGISEDMAVRISKQFRKHGDDGSLRLANGHLWKDDEALQTFKAAVLKDVDRTIVTPGKGEAPLWTGGEMGKIVFQFKSFAASAHQKVLISDLQFRDAAALNGFLLASALGSASYGLKSWFAGREISDDPGKVITESLDRSGAFGYLWDVNNTISKATRGTVSVQRAFGVDEPMSRYASRNVVGSILGPSFGTVTDMVGVTGSIAKGDFSRRDLRKVRRMLPAQNLFYIRHLLNALEEKTGRGLKR